MKKEIKITCIAVCAFALGLSLNNIAMSSIANYKVAIVDIQKVISNSAEVKALKTEQQNKVKDLQTFVEKARKDVSAQPDDAKKKALEDSYNKELNEKTKAIEKEYTKKLQLIDSNISAQISKEAQAKSYNLVLAKGVVLYGGEDITANIMKAVE